MEKVEIKIAELFDFTKEQWIQHLESMGALNQCQEFQVLEVELSQHGTFFMTYIYKDTYGIKYMGRYHSSYSESLGFMESYNEMGLASIKNLYRTYLEAYTSDKLEFDCD